MSLNFKYTDKTLNVREQTMDNLNNKYNFRNYHEFHGSYENCSKWLRGYLTSFKETLTNN
jgi:hypothetical protein